MWREHLTPGATTVGAVCKEGVVLCSEKRVSLGHFVLSKSGKKVFKISPNIGVACAGMVSDMQMLVRDVEANANLFRLDTRRMPSVRATARLVSHMLFQRRLFPLLTQILVGGVDEEGPDLYALDALGSLIQDKYACVGSGAQVAMGVIEGGYREDLAVSDLKDLAVRAVKSAISRDVASGNGIDVLVVTSDGIVEETIPL